MYGYNYLKNFLQEEGFRLNEESSYISFKFQGSTFIAFKSESPFLQIVMICNTKSYSRSQLLEVCNTMNSDKFVIKFVVSDENVWCSYEFQPTENTKSDEFETALYLIDKASDELFEKLSK